MEYDESNAFLSISPDHINAYFGQAASECYGSSRADLALQSALDYHLEMNDTGNNDHIDSIFNPRMLQAASTTTRAGMY